VGSLTSGLTATLELTATASADELMEVVAQSTRSSPVDTNAANNRATVRVFGLRAALFSNGFESNP
jgi:hypothetical protein